MATAIGNVFSLTFANDDGVGEWFFLVVEGGNEIVEGRGEVKVRKIEEGWR